MNRTGLLIALACITVFSGCVLQSEYKAKLAEMDGLQKSRSSVEEKLRATEKELAEVKQQYEELLRQKNALAEENAAIKSALEAKREQLAREVVELKAQIAEARRTIKSHEEALTAKNREAIQLRTQADQLAQEKAKAVEEKERAIAGMKDTYESLVKELKQEIKEGEIQITQLRDKLTVNMVEKILFDSGSAVIKKNGRKVLDRMAGILKNVAGQQIKVEGHTDNVPIGPTIIDKFSTNWELSTARATTVVRYLQERGINPSVLSAEGYSEYRPVAPNDTDENKSKNRRIEIVLVPLDVNR